MARRQETPDERALREWREAALRLAEEPAEEFLAVRMAECLDDARQALVLRQPGAATSSRMRAVELYTEIQRLRELRQEQPQTALQTARALRERADRAGSHTAAAGYFRLELELEAVERARREEERQRGLAELTLDAKLERLVQALHALPEGLRESVIERVAAPVH